MSSTAWIVLGGVAAVGLYIYYRSKVDAAQIRAMEHPANILANKSAQLVQALGETFGASYERTYP